LAIDTLTFVHSAPSPFAEIAWTVIDNVRS
jgi:hypothetical protein